MDYGWCGVGVVLWRNLPAPASNIMGPGQAASNPRVHKARKGRM